MEFSLCIRHLLERRFNQTSHLRLFSYGLQVCLSGKIHLLHKNFTGCKAVLSLISNY